MKIAVFLLFALSSISIVFVVYDVSEWGFVILFPLVTFLLLLLLGTSIYDYRKQKKTSKFVLILIFLVISSSFVGSYFRKNKLATERKSATLVIRELETFLSQKDSLPSSLEELNTKIIRPELFYSKKGKDFEVFYLRDNLQYCTYNSKYKEWYCGD